MTNAIDAYNRWNTDRKYQEAYVVIRQAISPDILTAAECRELAHKMLYLLNQTYAEGYEHAASQHRKPSPFDGSPLDPLIASEALKQWNEIEEQEKNNDKH